MPCSFYRQRSLSNHQYIIQTGDTLYKIARRQGVTVQSLIAANPNIKNAGTISAGQKLCLPAAVGPAAEQMDSMTLKEKIGQMVMAGLAGYAMDENTRSLINDYYVGGFVLFDYNVQDPGQLLAPASCLKLTNSRRKAPLFAGVDEEVGRMSRLLKELKDLPSIKAIVERNSSELSCRTGIVISEEIKALALIWALHLSWILTAIRTIM